MKRLRLALFPPSAVDERDTGLRFTDILFGFVILQLFLRLQDWGGLPGFVQWQLIAGTTLVLGSWIGFRRSVNRSDYQPKFFNLPFFRFVLDQVMVLLYFRVAVLYPNNVDATVGPSTNTANAPPDPSTLAHDTVFSLLLIFALYAAWDVLGIRMAYVREGGKPKYPEISEDGKGKTEIAQDPNWKGLTITVIGLLVFVLLYFWVQGRTLDMREAKIAFAIATMVLLAYRFVKEIRTSWKKPASSPTTTPGANPAEEAAATAAAEAAKAATAAAMAAEAAAAATAASAEAATAAASSTSTQKPPR